MYPYKPAPDQRPPKHFPTGAQACSWQHCAHTGFLASKVCAHWTLTKAPGLRQDSDYHVHLTNEKTGVGRLSDSSEILVCVCSELSLGPGPDSSFPFLPFLQPELR